MQTYHRTVYEEAPATVEIPSALKHRRVEVIMLLLDETAGNGKQTAVDELGWPIGFFTATYGALPDFPARCGTGSL